MSVIITGDGKYQTEHDNGRITVYRHTRRWDRNFLGDGYVLSLVQRIEDLEEQCRDLVHRLSPVEIERDYADFDRFDRSGAIHRNQ